MRLSRRTLLAAAIASTVLAAPAQAQITGRTITLVVPFAAGGGVDVLARLIAERLRDTLKQSVVVENRTGAGGAVGIDYVAKAAPDGHTILLMDIAAVLLKSLNNATPFDVVKDFAPVAEIGTTPLLVFANPSLPVNDPKGLIAYAKANPGKLSAGIPGVGTPHHLAAAMLNAEAKIDITAVPYRGSVPAMNDLVGGQIPLSWSTPIAVVPLVEAKKVKPIGAASMQRVPLFPNTPTFAESALPGFNVDIWFGIAAPGKTPPDIVARYSKAMQQVMAIPELKQRMEKLGYGVHYADGTAFAKLIRSDYEKYGKVIREAGIKPH